MPSGTGSSMPDNADKLRRRRQEEVSRVFDEIDADGDGILTAAELRAYAQRKGLPTNYAAEFLAAARGGEPWVRQNSRSRQQRSCPPPFGSSPRQERVTEGRQGIEKRGGAFGWSMQKQGDGTFQIGPFHIGVFQMGPLRLGGRFGPLSGGRLQGRVDLQRFQQFVAMKDEAVMASFDAIDSNGDGVISFEELENQLQKVQVICSPSGSKVAVKRTCLSRMMKRVKGGRQGEITREDFCRFFTLLPSSDLLLDYWFSASCPSACSDTGAKVPLLLPSTSTPVSASRSASSPNSAERQSAALSLQSSWRHLVAGAAAGACSRTLTAPLETLRLRMMMAGGAATLSAACRDLWLEAGWRGFYQGNTINVARSAPQKAIDFFSFEVYKRLLSTLPAALGHLRKQQQQPELGQLLLKTHSRRSTSQQNGSLLIQPPQPHPLLPSPHSLSPPSPSWQQLMLAGGLAGATSTLLLYPLDVVRSRITVSSREAESLTILQHLKQIAAAEGFSGLYRGLPPSLLSILPEAAITYGSFDSLKRLYQSVHQTTSVPVLPSLICGVTSAFMGQLVSYPLELVARRMQVGSTTSASSVLKELLAQEGIAGLYRGIGPASLKIVPMAIVSFGVYEGSKIAMERIEAWHDVIRQENEEIEFERMTRPIKVESSCGMM